MKKFSKPSFKSFINLILFLLVGVGVSNQVTAQEPGLYVYPNENEPVFPYTPTDEQLNESINCNDLDPENPCPYDEGPILYVRVNMHYLLSSWGAGNFTEHGDGAGGSYNGYQRAEDIINSANQQMEENTRQWGTGTTTDVCKINIRLVLNGVYFHRTNLGLDMDSLAVGKVSFKTLIRNGVNNVNRVNIPLWNFMESKFVNRNFEINIFEYNSDVASGVAGGGFTNIHDGYEKYIKYERDQTNGTGGVPSSWSMYSQARILLHEMFHLQGLWRHPFDPDGCDDTPTLPNAGSAGNNLMDYNSFENWSLSPCQICLLNQNWDTRLYEPRDEDDCPPLSVFFDMKNEICSDEPVVFLEGTASFNETSYFLEIVEVANVGDPTGTGGYYSSEFEGQVGNVNLNDCYYFECGKNYKVKLALKNECGEWEEKVDYVAISCPPCFGADVVKEECHLKELSLSPNPGNDFVNISYTLSMPQQVTLTLNDLISGQQFGFIKQNVQEDIGNHNSQYNVSNMPEGSYFIRAITEECLVTEQLTISR